MHRKCWPLRYRQDPSPAHSFLKLVLVINNTSCIIVENSKINGTYNSCKYLFLYFLKLQKFSESGKFKLDKAGQFLHTTVKVLQKGVS